MVYAQHVYPFYTVRTNLPRPSFICYNGHPMANDTISLKLEERTVLGKAVRQLRRDGQIPAVIHDHGKPSVHVQADAVAVQKVWRAAGKHHPINLKNGSKDFVALIKNVDFDPKKHQIRHVVFNAVDKNQKVEAEVPIRPRYDEGNENSPAERSGLIVLAQLEAVKVRSVPDKLPELLEYNAEKLVEIGDHVVVGDLIVPEGVEFITEPEHSIATVYEPSALAAANDAAAGEAEAEDVANVEAEEGGDTDQEGQSPEDRPGGKEQKEPKPSSVEAAKEDKHEHTEKSEQ
jgi:large subunit ribosomal protein L25